MESVLNKVRSCTSAIPEPIKKAWKNPPHISLKIAGYAALVFLALKGSLTCGNEGYLNDVVFVSIVDEILFRGVIHSVIHSALGIFNGRNPTESQRETQRTVAILTTATLYAAANTDGSPFFCFWFLSRALGYMSESTGSLLPAMAFHGLHNAIVMSARSINSNGFWHPATIVDCVALALLEKSCNPFKAALETYRSIAERPRVGQVARQAIKWMCLASAAVGTSMYAVSVLHISPTLISVGMGALGALRIGYELHQKRRLRKIQQELAALQKQQSQESIRPPKRYKESTGLQKAQTTTIRNVIFESNSEQVGGYKTGVSLKRKKFNSDKTPSTSPMQKQAPVKTLPADKETKKESKEHIDYSGRARSIRNVLNTLTDYGFKMVRKKGSHAQMLNKNTGKVFTVPIHNEPICRRAQSKLQKQLAMIEEPLDLQKIQQELAATKNQEPQEPIGVVKRNKAEAQEARAIQAAAAIESALCGLSPEQFGQYLFLKTNVTVVGYKFDSKLDIVQVRRDLSLYLACQYLKIDPQLVFEQKGDASKAPVQTPTKSPLIGTFLKARNLLLANLVDSGHIVEVHSNKQLRNADSPRYTQSQKEHLELCNAKEWFANLEHLFV